MGQHGDGVFQFGFVQEAARAQQGGGGVAQHFFHHAAHIVVGIQFFVYKRHPFAAQSGRQGEFEFRQAFIAQRAAETDDSGLADGGAFGNFGHGGMDEPFRLGQSAFGHFAFRTRQVVQGLADFIQHIFLLILLFDFQTASRHTGRPSENTVCRFLTTRVCPPKPPPRRQCRGIRPARCKQGFRPNRRKNGLCLQTGGGRARF